MIHAVGDSDSLPNRIQKMVDAAGSQHALAELFGVVDGTLINWLRGAATPQPYIQQRIVERTGISKEWLVHGVGNERNELEKLQKKCQESSDENVGLGARVAEDGANYSTVPMHALPPITTACERYLELAADMLGADKLARLIESVLKDEKAPQGERQGTAMRLASMLQSKIQREQRPSNRSSSSS